MIKQIHFFGEGSVKVVDSHTVDIEKELNINSEQTSNFRFAKWFSPTEFEAEVLTRIFNFKILNIQNIQVTEKK